VQEGAERTNFPDIMGMVSRRSVASTSKSGKPPDAVRAYDDVLRKNGYFAGGEALQSDRNAATLRWMNGKVSVTGPIRGGQVDLFPLG
jgi:hypothetical protein